MQHSAASCDVLVAGAGVAGLASAASIAGSGVSVVLMDRHPRAGMETSTHNSGVIHAGLYYPPGSLKARLCVEGRDRLYEFCARRGVPHARTGKLVVATSNEEVEQLEALMKRAHANGVTDVTMIRDGEIEALQPGLRARVALLSPSTGIVASDALVGALLQECRESGGRVSPRHAARRRRTDPTAASRCARHGRRFMRRVVVNAAGLYADDVSKMLGGEEFKIYPCRGEYAELSARRHGQIKMPVYPLPHASGHGLGTHVTPTIGGPILLGPTVRYQERKDDYESDRLPLEDFLEAARSLLTDVELADLRLGGTGIRAKFHPPEESFADFHIAHDTRAPGLIHAAGIDSPGLTSCLAIGEMVARLVDRNALASRLTRQASRRSSLYVPPQRVLPCRHRDPDALELIHRESGIERPCGAQVGRVQRDRTEARFASEETRGLSRELVPPARPGVHAVIQAVWGLRLEQSARGRGDVSRVARRDDAIREHRHFEPCLNRRDDVPRAPEPRAVSRCRPAEDALHAKHVPIAVPLPRSLSPSSFDRPYTDEGFGRSSSV